MTRCLDALALTLAIALVSPRLVLPRSSPSAPQSYSSRITLNSERAPSDFPPDGDLSKQVWRRTKWVRFDHNMSGHPRYPELSTRVASLWTSDNIYFAFSCNYDALNVFEGEDISKERWELWDRDVAEVFLNPQPDHLLHYYEFEVAPNNQWIDLEITRSEKPNHDAAWNSGFAHATLVDVAHHIWTAEIRIPLASMGAPAAKPGMQWRVNFFRAAGQGGDSQRKFLAWSTIPEGKTFHAPSRFGLLRLVR